MTVAENGDEAEGAAPLGDDHWSKSRAGQNEEALEYYRERSKAPGVEGGGGMRNHYCFECDGVIEFRIKLNGHGFVIRNGVCVKPLDVASIVLYGR